MWSHDAWCFNTQLLFMSFHGFTLDSRSLFSSLIKSLGVSHIKLGVACRVVGMHSVGGWIYHGNYIIVTNSKRQYSDSSTNLIWGELGQDRRTAIMNQNVAELWKCLDWKSISLPENCQQKSDMHIGVTQYFESHMWYDTLHHNWTHVKHKHCWTKGFLIT